MNRMKKLFYKISLTVFLVSLFSCNVGLGEAIDLVAPTLNVITPERNGMVAQIVNISGTAYDEQGIKNIFVSIDETQQEFRWAANEWAQNVNGSWEKYLNASSSVENNKVTWSIEVPIKGATTASTYTLIVRATDEMGNEGNTSKDERTITVDITEPEVSITYPVITSEYTSALSKYNSYTLKDNNCLQVLVNKSILVSGYQKEDCKLDKLLVFIDEETSSNIPDLSKEIDSYVYKKEITGTGLRNWSFTIANEELPVKFHSDKHLLRLVTESHDSAGNVERKVQGWFTYWNEADNPWIVADFGFASEAAVTENVYPSCALQGQAYDDDGLKQIVVEVYKKNPLTSLYDIKVDDKCINQNLETLNYPTFYSWTVYALAESCDFKIIAKCTDKNGVQSVETVERYMKVSDVNPPVIKVTTNTESSLFGDVNGDFKIEGYVIDDDKTRIPSLTMVWIKNEENLANYVNSNYIGWKSDISATTGDKRYVISLPSADLEQNQYYGVFSKQLNLFTDLGIAMNGNTLKTQNFALLSVDGGDQSAISFISFAGDYEKPELTVDKIIVDSKEYSFKDPSRSGNLNLPPFKRNESGVITSKVKLSGTWKDNSTEIWNKNTTKIGKVTVNWTGYGLLTVNMTSTGWETQEITPPDSSTASITAELIDIGGNTATVNECFNININKPELVRITANSDGYYKQGDSILIKLEFNKAVTFSGGTSNPVLKFNNSAVEASYTSGNGEAVHCYTYTVGANQNFNPLDVTSIITNGNVWKDSKDTAIDSLAIPTEDANKLKGNKKIVVDTILPTVSSVSAISSSGYYKKDATLYFTVKFSENVSFSKLSDIKLVFNNGIEVGAPSAVGTDTLMFKYIVGNNQNANPLSLASISFGDCVTTDYSNNVLKLTDKKINYASSPITGIVIDTAAPAQPVISGITGSGEVIYDSSVTFTITGYENESGTKKKYSTDNGVTYKDYTSPVTIETNGTYTIKAYQEDTAGNRSTDAVAKTFTLDSGNVLTNVTSSNPNGTYTTGDTINFVLSFRKPVDASATSLSLQDKKSDSNFQNKTASYSSSSADKKTITYSYTVVEGDTCEQLNVKEISGVLKDTQSTPATIASSYYSIPSGYGFTDNRSNVKIVTGKPKLITNGFVFDGNNKITLTFDRKVTKGSGNITITQNKSKSAYLVPAVLTEQEYALVSDIDTYYDEGTNGSDSAGNLELTKKYILKYNKDIDDADIVAKFENAGVFSRVIDVGSNSVTKKSDTEFEILLSDNSLEVKGAYYSCSIGAGCFTDEQNKTNDLITDKEMFIKGVCKPTIRINKQSGGAKWVNDEVVISNPLKAEVKIDCRTPQVGITYQEKYVERAERIFSKDNKPEKRTGGYTPAAEVTGKSNYDSSNKKYSSVVFEVGNNKAKTGYSSIISTTSSINTTENPNASESSYETANRTSFIFKLENTYKNEGGDTTINTTSDGYKYLWIRGGDSISGGVITPGFPLSWKSEDLSKIQAMIELSSNDDSAEWGWVSWELSVPTYVHFIRGNTPTTEDHTKNGPDTWGWAGQGFTLHIEDCPVYPGDTLSFTDDDSGYNLNLCFYKKHCEYRTGTVVTKSQK